MRQIVLIAHNLRSCHNVGSLLRTAEGLGASVYLSGYTPHPGRLDDPRLPHLARRQTARIHKTALGAEETVKWTYNADITTVITALKGKGFTVIALEQTPDATPLSAFLVPDKTAIVVGREVEGLEPEVLTLTDGRLFIPMFGSKESFNVVQAAAMSLYHCRFH